MKDRTRVFKTKAFQRFAVKAAIPDLALCRAICDTLRGLIAADLGGGVIKQRIARPGQGKSGGFRTLIAFRAGARTIFVHGFAKNERDNIGKLFAYDAKTLARVLASGLLLEVNCDEETIS